METTKKIAAVFLFLCLALCKVNAQKKINEGTITYTVTYELNADQLQYQSMLPKEITCYFRGDSCASIVNQGPAIIKGVTVFKTNYRSLLVDIPSASKKIVTVFTPDEVAQEKAANPQLTGVKGTEKQVIDGYKCNKVTVTDTKSGNTYEVWVTNDIELAPNSVSKLVSGFGGVPVKFVTFNRGIRVNAEIKEIKEAPVPPGFFSATKDYQPMTLSELQAM
jgi:hypothetical protein